MAKDAKVAEQYLVEGETHLKNRKVDDAYQYFCVALSYCEQDSDSWLRALERRSHALLEMDEPRASIRDVDRAMASKQCDETMKKKLRHRKLLACSLLKDLKEAEEKDMSVASLLNAVGRQKLHKGPSAMFPTCSSALEMKWSKRRGRGHYAKEAIPAGSLLMRETPYASVLHEQFTGLLCMFCNKPLPPDHVPCQRCSDENVRFCDEICRDVGDSQFHKFECENKLGIHANMRVLDDITLKLALVARIIGKATVQELETYKENANIETPKELLKGENYKANFASILTLTGEVDNRQLGNDQLGWIENLAQSDKLKEIVPDRKQIKERRALANQIFRLLIGKMGRNMHGIMPLFPEEKNTLYINAWKNCKNTHIGVGIYPIQALINHSCLPNCISTHVGNTVEVRALRDIAVGEEVLQSYGPRYGEAVKDQRQFDLQNQYKFECHCPACTESKYDIDEELLMSYICDKCGAPRAVDTDTVVLCLKCSKQQDYAVEIPQKAIKVVDGLLPVFGGWNCSIPSQVDATTLTKAIGSLRKYYPMDNLEFVELIRKAAELLVSSDDQIAATIAVDLYELLLTHNEKFFTRQSEQYEKILFETLLAYNAAEKTNERLLELSNIYLKLIHEQCGLHNARRWIAMRYGKLGKSFFDDIFKSFGNKFLQMEIANE